MKDIHEACVWYRASVAFLGSAACDRDGQTPLPPCTLLLRFGLCGPRGASDCGYRLVGWIDSSDGDYRQWARDDLMVIRSVVWR